MLGRVVREKEHSGVGQDEQADWSLTLHQQRWTLDDNGAHFGSLREKVFYIQDPIPSQIIIQV